MSQETTRTIETRQVPAAGTWTIDPTHTTIAAVARHLMVTKVRGHFSSFSGTINVAETPEDSTVEITMDAASITTGTEDRDNHLRSADFLDAEKFPALTFRSTSVVADGDRWKLTGERQGRLRSLRRVGAQALGPHLERPARPGRRTRQRQVQNRDRGASHPLLTRSCVSFLRICAVSHARTEIRGNGPHSPYTLEQEE